MTEPKYKIGDQVIIDHAHYGTIGRIIKVIPDKFYFEYLVNQSGNLLVGESDLYLPTEWKGKIL